MQSFANHHHRRSCGRSEEIAIQVDEKEGACPDFFWQAGYGAFSVSQSNVEKVRDYIARQEEHHRKLSFQEEFRALCVRHGLAIDERYVWD